MLSQLLIKCNVVIIGIGLRKDLRLGWRLKKRKLPENKGWKSLGARFSTT
jgi:hypothetical protein